MQVVQGSFENGPEYVLSRIYSFRLTPKSEYILIYM